MGINLNSIANFFVRTRNDDTADGNDGLTAGNPASMGSYNADIGYKEQVAATTDTGVFSLIQLFKRFLSTKLPLGANTTANALCAALPTDDTLRTNIASVAVDATLIASDADATRVSVASIDTKTTTSNGSLSSIDTKLTTSNDSLASIDSKLGQANTEVTYSWTRPNDAVAYTIGDMVSDSTTTPTVPVWTGLVANPGETAEIVKVTISCSQNATAQFNFRLVLFKSSPTTAADNLPNTISDNDVLTTNCIGYIDIPAFVPINIGATAAGNSFQTVIPVMPIRFTTAATTGLFGAFIALAATTPVALTSFSCTLHVRRAV